MTTYAQVPAFAQTKPHPRTLLLIVGAHAAVLAAVMVAKMDIPDRIRPGRTIVEFIPIPQPPPPKQQPKPQEHQQTSRSFNTPPTELPIPAPNPPKLETSSDPVPLPPLTLPNRDPQPLPLPKAKPAPTGPRFATAPSELRPPYPEQKLASGEEASLQLRLSIDDRGRVVAVEPVGRADPAFLASARKHILRHWRYEPATVDGRPVPSSTVITLRFTLDD